MAKALLREKIFNAQDIRSEAVFVPEWDLEIEVRAMTGKARAHFLQNSLGADGKADLERMYPDLLIACVFDPEEGERLFDLADRDALNSKSGAALERVASVAMRLSGLTQTAADDAAKN